MSWRTIAATVALSAGLGHAAATQRFGLETLTAR